MLLTQEDTRAWRVIPTDRFETLICQGVHTKPRARSRTLMHALHCTSPSLRNPAALAQAKGALGRFFLELTSHHHPGSRDASPGRRDGSRRPRAAAAGPIGPRAADSAHADAGSERLLPGSGSFNAEAYLATFHADASARDLAAGLRVLERQLSERTGQLQLLVRS